LTKRDGGREEGGEGGGVGGMYVGKTRARLAAVLGHSFIPSIVHFAAGLVRKKASVDQQQQKKQHTLQ